jgi:serine/threonine protein kinase
MIARGGTAAVYRARDELLGATVAVKQLLLDGTLCTPQARAINLGFRTEALSAMRLSHPRIVRVFNYEMHPPWELLIMELVEGETVKRHALRQSGARLSPLDTLRVGVECLDALVYAHQMGVVHHDIKPSNILWTLDGSIKLCDFGLARTGAGSPDEPRITAGTPGFMSPERLRGEPGDRRSDLFSLGATLFVLGNGRPFPLDAVMRGETVDSGCLPVRLHEVLLKAASPIPELRYQTASEMRQELLEVRRGLDRHHALFAVPGGNSGALVMSLERSAGHLRAVPAPVHTETAASPPPDVPDGAQAADGPSVSVELEVDHPSSQVPQSAPAAAVEPVAGPELGARSTLIRNPAGRARRDGAVLCRIEGAVLPACADRLAPVIVPTFRIERLPVTNARYHAYLLESRREAPAHWLGGRPPAMLLDHPVVGITLEEARAYASWYGKRLPTVEEWEAAWRGATGRRFPWGDAWLPAQCQAPENGAAGTSSVGAHLHAATAEGVADLLGNVWEWTLPGSEGAPEPGYAWVMGGSFRHPCQTADGPPRTRVAEHKAYAYLGFRCVADGDGQGEC